MSLQLFCIPHAGGSATAFLRWRRFLPPAVELLPIELAGRGSRLTERPVAHARLAGADVATQILARRRTDVPYAVWGHSMGSLIAYEAYYALSGRTSDLPFHLVLSGRTAPHTPLSTTNIHKIPNDDSFIAAVDSYGGGTKEALADPNLRELFLPVLRADFELSESYEWEQKNGPISCGVTIVNGAQDTTINHHRIREWQDLISGPVEFRTAEGDHFFLYSNDHVVGSVIAGLRTVLARPHVNVSGKDAS